MNFEYIFLFIICVLLVIIIATLLQITNKSIKRQEFKKIRDGVNQIHKEFKNLRKEGIIMCIQKGAALFAPIPEFAREYNEQISSKNHPKRIYAIKTYAVNPSNRKIIASIIFALILGVFVFWVNQGGFSLLIVAANLTDEYNLLFLILNLAISISIALIITYVIVKPPKDKSEAKQKSSKSFVASLRSKSETLNIKLRDITRQKYYSKGVGLKYVRIAMLSKLIVFFLFLFSGYIIFLMTISIETISIKGISYLEIFDIVYSTFFFVGMVFYIYSMRKSPRQKFENFAFYFMFLGFFMINHLSEYNWKFIYYLIIFLVCLLLGGFAFILGRENARIIDKRDYSPLEIITWNLRNLIFLSFLFIDISVSVQFLLMVDRATLSVFELNFWVPIFFYITSLLSLIMYTRTIRPAFIRKNSTFFLNIVLVIISVILSVWTFMIYFNTLGFTSILLFLSQPILQLVIFVINSNLFNDIRKLIIKSKEKSISKGDSN